MNIVASTLLSFLPARYRRRFSPDEIPAAGAILSGLLESLVGLYLLIQGYNAYVQQRMGSLPPSALDKAGEQGGESAVMGFGSILMLEYLIHITTILLVFFLLEGLVRVIAAVGSRESLPTLPLKLVELLHSHFDAQNKERSLGERIRDEVQSADDGNSLRIASCRPKTWTHLTTISHDGGLFELTAEQKSAAPRPFVYLLRQKTTTGVIRGIYAYDPDEVLQATGAAER